MGKSCNFAIVPARLLVDEKYHGIQMFIVQLRGLETHQPLPGMSHQQVNLIIYSFTRQHTVKPVLSGPVLNGHPLLSGQL